MKPDEELTTVQIELSSGLLRALFVSRQLHAADLRCLNPHSQRYIRQLLSDSLKTPSDGG